MAGYGRKKRKRQNRLAVIAISFVMVLLTGVLTYQTFKLSEKRDDYDERLYKIETQIEEEESRAADLEEQRVYSQTKQFIEEEAKSKLGLVNPNEIILKPEE